MAGERESKEIEKLDGSINQLPQTIAPEVLNTPIARRLAAALCDPASMQLSITDLCKGLEIDRNTYYFYMRRADFMAAVRELRQAHLQLLIPGVVGLAVQSAAILGRDGHQDRKMILEMAGEYRQEVGVDVSGKVEVAYINDWRQTGQVVDTTAKEAVKSVTF